LRRKDYYNDFARMGIDPTVIIQDGTTDDVILHTAERDYESWKNKSLSSSVIRNSLSVA